MLLQKQFYRLLSTFKSALAKSSESLKYLKSPNPFETELKNLKELAAMSEDFEDELEGELESLNQRIREEILKTKFNQKNDVNGCFIELRAGAGGVEAQDLTQILARMYTRWGEKKDYQTKVADSSKGDIAGYKSIILSLKGEYAFGWAKYETGVHRFVRISPFDSNGKRHTSFVSVQVLPMLEKENSDIMVNPRDLKIEVMRAQGAGGQHVNTTESAVRITHLPTGIVVFCQNERSQHRNKAEAMEMLKAKLYAKHVEEQNKEKKDLYAQNQDVAWGNQIRSYVFHPYQMIKDSRTKVQTGKVQQVLDGDLDMFMEASMLQKPVKD